MSFSDRLVERLSSLENIGRLRALRIEPDESWVHNDYLGLSAHPALRAGQGAPARRAGSRGSRLLGGHTAAFEQLERAIAEFFDAPASLFFSSGFLANLAVGQALAEVADGIVADEKIHASLIDGLRLTKREKIVVPHNRWDLAPALVAARGWRAPLVVAESLYSMEGHGADIAALRAFVDGTEGFLIFDEAHAGGVFPESGRGVSAAWRNWDRMAVTVTFGKAFGAGGAAILCSELAKTWLVNSARSFLFTTASPPCVLELVDNALRVMRTEGETRRRRLWHLAESVRGTLRAGGAPVPEPKSFDGIGGRSPIVPFFVAGDDNALRFSQIVRDTGLAIKPIRYPTVPAGTERLRLSLNLGVDEAASIAGAARLVELWKAFSSREPTPISERPR